MTVSAPAEFSEAAKVGSEKSITRLIVATSIGNALEWYDITIYGYFAIYVSKAFFPQRAIRRRRCLLTFGTFGLAYLARPIGGVVLGAYADRHGRKASLLISIVLMTLGTLAVAMMPTYETIGILAPIAVLARAPGAGIFGRRRVRKLDSVSGGASARPAWFYRQLAICEPGLEQAARLRLRCRAHRMDGAGGSHRRGAGAFRFCSAFWSGRSASTFAITWRMPPRRRPRRPHRSEKSFCTRSCGCCSASARSRYRPRSII